MRLGKVIKQKGMTLVEVLVALSVFALTGGAILNVVMNTHNNYVVLEETFWAQLVADNVLSDLKINKMWPQDSWVTKDTKLADKDWYYRYRGQSTQDVSFKAIEVEVYSEKITSDSSPIVSLKTYINK